MLSIHKSRVASAFAARAKDYENHADLQLHAAAALARYLPELDAPKVLEVGCGTGFLTHHLLKAYPGGDFLITDIAGAMLDTCQASIREADRRNIRFAVLDGEDPETGERYDLIATSMTPQWFTDPAGGLGRLREQLAPGGHLLFGALGPDSFPEWRSVLAERGQPNGIVMPEMLPGIVHEEHIQLDLVDGLEFLRLMKAIGAATPRDGYRSLSAGALRGALRALDERHDGQVTWHLVYGHLTA